MKESEKDRREKEELCREERRLLIEGERIGSQQFDRAILNLSAGALALSITFLERVLQQPWQHTRVLAAAWVGFCTAIIFTLSSFLTSQSAHRKQLEILEGLLAGEESVLQRNSLAVWTQCLNIAAAVAFVTGTIVLLVFAYLNLSKGGSVA